MNVSLGSDETIAPPMASHSSAARRRDELIGEGKAWGLSMAVDLQDCRPETIRDREHIKAYVIALCELIGMKRYGDCQIVHFGEGRVAGYSMIQLIETSLISGHFANDTNRAYLDIFSCKGYDPSVVEAFSRDFFGALKSTASVTLRY
ncbi:MAG: S-adenosylmethionine decarboxylase [Nitrospiraceae bacterium]